LSILVFILKAPGSIPYPSFKLPNEKSPEDYGRTNKMDGAFELFAVFYQPALGAAHRFATEVYVSAFNAQMDVMVKNPERFLGEPNKPGAANRSRPVGSETNRTPAAAGSGG